MKIHYSCTRCVYLLLIVCLASAGFNRAFAQDQELKLVFPLGHTDEIHSVVFSPDGTRVLTASADQTAKVWDIATGAVLLDLQGHTSVLLSAAYSSDGMRIVTASGDSTVKIWDAKEGRELLELRGHKDAVSWASFSADGKRIVSASYDKTARIWDAQTGQFLLELKGHTDKVDMATFSPDGQHIVTASHDHFAKVWDARSGAALLSLDGDAKFVRSATYSPDGTRIITAGVFGAAARMWDATSGKELHTYRNILYGHKSNLTYAVLSPDATLLATSSVDRTAKIWDVQKDEVLLNLTGHNAYVTSVNFSPDGKYVVTSSSAGTVMLWDAHKGTTVLKSYGEPNELEAPRGIMLRELRGRSNAANYAAISADGSRVATAGSDHIVRVWDAHRGALLLALGGHKAWIPSLSFSPDGTRLAVGYYDGKARVWDTQKGVQLLEMNHYDQIQSIAYSPDGTKIATGGFDKRVKIWDTQNGALISNFKAHRNPIYFLAFSPDGTTLVSTPLVKAQLLRNNSDNTAKIWDVRSGKLLQALPETKATTYHASFSPDGKRLITASHDKTAKVWEVATGKLMLDLNKHPYDVITAWFSTDATHIITTCGDTKARTWNAATGEELPDLAITNIKECYSRPQGTSLLTMFNGIAELRNPVSQEIICRFIPIDSADYLVVDKYSRFDGTPNARKQVYFTCGSEKIGLDQVKDQLWVPNLVERLTRGEVIKGKTLAELGLCGLTPEVKVMPTLGASYRYQIVPRRGGLREAVLLVNGIEVMRRTPLQLTKTAKGYEWTISRAELLPYFVAGLPNIVTVKAYTQRDGISSRGAEVVDTKKLPDAARPNLYAVMVGVSNYQGTDLDLTYAAKDAQDLAGIVESSARKLLNTDGREHVYLYRLTTATGHDKLPQKLIIRGVFEEISKKAKANDIILVFFAGHGVVGTEKKQFYFLTADASRETARTAIAQVGISTQELTEWLRPDHIKAQKRVLILDACNSGQAINDLVKIGQPNQQYLAARGDDQAQQMKAIERLNERSGMFVISAAASNQKAYEMGQYSQGLLTYALLNAIKTQPDILDSKMYLNINRWFNTAGQTVSELGLEMGVRQQPQVVQTATGFNIGVVDADVLAKIVLPQQKPLFCSSSFQNQDAVIASDDLDMNAQLNKELSALSSGSNASITFAEYATSADSYSLTGRYEVKGNAIKVTIDIRRGKASLNRFEESGTKDNLKFLAIAITTRAIDWAAKYKQ